MARSAARIRYTNISCEPRPRAIILDGMRYRVVDEIWPISSSDLGIELLRSLDDGEFRELCRRIRGRILASGGDRRMAARVVRQLQKKRNPKRHLKIPKSLMARKIKPSPILDNILKDRRRIWINPIKRKEEQEIILDGFSFLDNPITTMEALENIARAECVSLRMSVHFDDPMIRDIGPYLVLAEMRQDMAPVLAGGRMNIPVQKVIEAVNIRQYMGINKFSKLQDVKDVWAFELRRRRKSETSKSDNLFDRPTTKEKTSDELVDTVDEWLDALDPPFELKKDAKGYLSRLCNEILENAERHSRRIGDGSWTVSGFMAKRNYETSDKEEITTYQCHLSFLSIGETIAESIFSCPEEIRVKLNDYCDAHLTRFSPRLSRETLATVFALQDGISRLPQIESKGGVGMMDMVQFVNDLGLTDLEKHHPAISIVSGTSYVKFDDRFPMGVRDGVDKPRLQWFNLGNTPKEPPAASNVFELPYRFPGTVLSIRFTFDQEFLRRLSESNQGS